MSIINKDIKLIKKNKILRLVDPDWAKRGIFYHIYPLGYFGAPKFGKQ